MQKKQSKYKVYESLLVIVLGFATIQYFTKWPILLEAVLGIGLLGVISFPFAQKVVQLWLKLAEFMGNISGKIILSLVFFLFLTPIALLYRLFQSKNKNKKGWQKLPKNYLDTVDFTKVW